MTVSDEPTRLAEIISQYVAGQSGSHIATAEDVGQDITLKIGADRGDDCAVYRVGDDLALVVGSDYVRGAGFSLFELGLLSLHDIGYFLVAANVSDVASMGAKPIGVLTVIRYPKDLPDRDFHEIVKGIHSACQDFDTLNVGGDIGGADRIVLSGTALGACRPSEVLSRSGARPGDAVILTGPTGIAGAAMLYFINRASAGWSVPDEIETRLLDAWRRPKPQIEAGRLLGSRRLATACQDTSDGLKATLEQIAQASNVEIIIDEHRIPIDRAVSAVAQESDLDHLGLTFSTSVDFQLVCTIQPTKLDELSDLLETHNLESYMIGNVTSVHSSGHAVLRSDSEFRSLPGVSWRHQADTSTDMSSKIIEEMSMFDATTTRRKFDG